MRRHLTVLLVALLPWHAACASTAEPPRDGIYPELIEHPVPQDFSAFQQPESLRRDLERIQNGSLEERIEALKEKALRDLVFVEGGSFLMGDFGPEHNVDGLPWSGEFHARPLHEVTLDSFSISRYKVTLAEFDVYTEANGLPRVLDGELDHVKISANGSFRDRVDHPAGASWEMAAAYCSWLADVTGRSFQLPTEAQWEFAARNRGRWIVWATDNGHLERNLNLPSGAFLRTWGFASGTTYPIGYFPPNPLQLFDLAHNGLEWVQDWYDKDYYARESGFHNPRGPGIGQEKVQRSRPPSDDTVGMTMHRRSAPLQRRMMNFDTGENEAIVSPLDTFRCAVGPLAAD